MELCDSCKRKKCNRKIIVTQQEDVKVITCLEYEKDKSKIKGYRKPLEVLAERNYIVKKEI